MTYKIVILAMLSMLACDSSNSSKKNNVVIPANVNSLNQECLSMSNKYKSGIEEVEKKISSLSFQEIPSLKDKFEIKKPFHSFEFKKLSNFNKTCQMHFDKYLRANLGKFCESESFNKKSIEKVLNACDSVREAISSKFYDDISLWDKKNKDFLDFLDLRSELTNKYHTHGRLMRNIKNLRVKVVANDLESMVNKSLLAPTKSYNILTGESTDPDKLAHSTHKERRIVDGKSYNYFWSNKHLSLQDARINGLDDFLFLYKSSDNFLNAAQMVCDLRYDKSYDSRLRFSPNYKSFETNKVYSFHEYFSKSKLELIPAINDCESLSKSNGFFKGADCLHIRSKDSSVLKLPQRSFEIRCISRTSEQMTVENVNKTLDGIIKLEVLNYKNIN